MMPSINAHELALIKSVFRRHPDITGVRLFGSRAKGTHTARSDVDLAVTGFNDPLKAEALAAELDELPLPYRFEVQASEKISHQPLREHIEREGIQIYPENVPTL
jgi:predicted nucleotidyltransferase